jgi:predicted dehydrogenase
MPRSLVIGMGIGQLYKTVLEKLGHEVVTVDSDISKGANFPNVQPALLMYNWFDTVHICTPNFTHYELADKVSAYTKMVFVEKPGFKTRQDWEKYITHRPFSRLLMVKNNMWRSNITELQELANRADTVNIKWIRKNCIPSPGSWFTTRELAFGGVSRDLMPHLLSLYIALNDKWQDAQMTGQEARQVHTLDKIEDTEYGAVKRDGIYDVDDVCKIKYMDHGRVWKMEANWADGVADNRSVEFEMNDGTVKRFELGLCPEEAYRDMIDCAITNVSNDAFWNRQHVQDIWIHDRIQF